MRRQMTAWGALLLVVLMASVAGASGSYVPRAAQRAGLDDYGKYELGKKVSIGEIELAERDLEVLEAQEPILAALQARLPRSARGRLDLPAYAGRLDAEQLDALRYYLRIRYKVR